jgi:hypothetical protein
MDLVPKIWEDLKLIGFEGSITTSKELYTWLLMMNKRFMPIKCESRRNNLIGPGFSYQNITPFDKGNYGGIYTSMYCKGDIQTLVFIKKCPQYPRTLIMESFLQQIAGSILTQYGFIQAVPRILDIIEDPNDGVICAMEFIPNSVKFSNYLTAQLQLDPVEYNFDHTIFEIIAQVASYMCILENSFHFNHRDLKSNNILVILPTEEWSHDVTLGSIKWSIKSECKVILIDFGMSCIGTQNGKVIASADSSMMGGAFDFDFCPKEGRDLFLFFVNLWNIPELRNALSPKGRHLFTKWLQDKSKRNWADEFMSITTFQKIKENFENMCRRVNVPTFRSVSSNPLSVLRDISEAYPEIVSVRK